MRRALYILIISLLALSQMSFAKKRVMNIPLRYSLKDFKLNGIDSLFYITTTKYHLGFDSDSLAPATPFISVNILIGHDEEVTDVSFTQSETIIENNIKLVPNPTYTTNPTLSAKQNINVDYANQLYPRDIIENITTNTMDGYRYLTLHVYPFKYDTGTKELHFIESFDLSLNISSQNRKANAAIGKNMREIVKNLVINPADLDVYYAQQTPQKHLFREANPDSIPIYLIITRDSLKNAFQELANWKKKKGYRTKILTVEDIDQHYTGKNLQLKIKNALKDYYDGTYAGLRYVLLGGDAEYVPVQYCYSLSDTIPADIFYACFNIMDWDSNNNNIGGESGENIDLNQDIYVTRVPVRNNAEVANFIHRNLIYEKEKCTPNYYNRILMGGAKIKHYYNINGIIVSDAQFGGDSIYTANIAPNWNGTLIRLYDTGTSFPGGSSYDFTYSHLQTELAKGYPFVYIGTHGNKYAWQTEDPYGYWTNDASSLIDTLSLNANGIGTTHIITTACHTNAFDLTTTCLSEAFLRNPFSGVLTYFGSSREGLYSNTVNPSLGPSDDYNAKYLEDVFINSNKKFSYHVSIAKNKYKSYTQSNYKFLQFAINPLGDPELPILTGVPEDITDVEIIYINSSAFLEINPSISGCLVCTTSRYDCGQSFFSRYVGSDMIEPMPQGLFDICISKDGYQPKIITISNSPYIQNDTFENDTKIFSDFIRIGSNVTTSRPEGPVIIEKGKTEIILHSGVKIKNNFKVKPGAEFKIIKDS